MENQREAKAARVTLSATSRRIEMLEGSATKNGGKSEQKRNDLRASQETLPMSDLDFRVDKQMSP